MYVAFTKRASFVTILRLTWYWCSLTIWKKFLVSSSLPIISATKPSPIQPWEYTGSHDWDLSNAKWANYNKKGIIITICIFFLTLSPSLFTISSLSSLLPSLPPSLPSSITPSSLLPPSLLPPFISSLSLYFSSILSSHFDIIIEKIKCTKIGPYHCILH